MATLVDRGTPKYDSSIQKLNQSLVYIGDSLLKNKHYLLKNYIEKYLRDKSGLMAYDDSILKSQFEGIKNIGSIKSTGKNDTVFVLPPFKIDEEGESYVFFDTSLPRLLTDSYCCHPDNMFRIGDIDEDGNSEICLFHSACASRYKSLIVYSLKNNEWKQVGACAFDVSLLSPSKEKRIRKISKGKFEMLEVLSETGHSSQKKWKSFSF